MRLFLSSYKAGRHNAELLELLEDVREVGVISNAKDYHQPERRAQRMEEVYDFFKSLGIAPKEIDLRPYFKTSSAGEELANHNFIWLAGGNVFLLRRALKYSGAGAFLGNAARRNEIILGGESAGAIIMGPTLKYSETDEDEDSPGYIPESYDKKAIWEGLDFISYVPVPHYNSPGYIGIAEYAENLKKVRIPFKTMTDDQAIIISGDKEEFLA